MNRIILFFMICFCYIQIQAQEQVFSYSSNGTIIAKPKYVETFENEDYPNTTPYDLKVSENISTNSGNRYTIKALKYKNWDNDPGDFTVIQIIKDGNIIYTIKKDDGWDYVSKQLESYTTHKSCFVEKLNSNTIALLFTGITIMSQPPYITMILLKDKKATLVLNKPSYIEKLQQSDGKTILTLCANTVEWREDGTPFNDAIINTLTIKDGMIYFK